ncbi:FAD-binding and (Fe-S)-binding domain-containing protein [Iodobacter arcticus]|uniref:FAD-binding and (Fe-S)-binding domain-containing protein n=1 Tax=Iodobacter arcticus TaxID=590593 RepID=A0ABW2R103_9NEIS
MIPRLSKTPAPQSLYLDFIAELRLRGFAGEISSTLADRTVLATDNSIYQLLPQAAVFPKHNDDVIRVVKLASEARFCSIKLYPRGGGTGTNGQSLGDGLVVDLSKNMNAILEINAEQRWARVQTGVVKDQLNKELAQHGLFFAPELSTSNRATIGGMINTDASGQGSCLYGKTRDHVLELDTVLLDGTLWHSQPLSSDGLAAVCEQDDLIAHVHGLIAQIHKDHSQQITATFPKLNRCLTGYDLAHIYNDKGQFDLNAILCGSEGTLGLIVEAKLNVLPLPKYSALINIRYASFDAALRDAPHLMALGAASIETVDFTILQLAKGDLIWHGIREFFPEDATPTLGINLLEVLSETESHLAAQIAHIEQGLQGEARLGFTVARGDAAVKRIWGMRKKSVGLLANRAGNAKPIPFVEDTAVPPENLADYIHDFRALLDQHGLFYGMFGHVDAGVLHVRPAIDMKEPNALAMLREISDGVAALTQKYHGVLWGEHGKGLRSEYAPAFFGKLYPCLQQIKQVFDPHNQLNPGKIASPDALIKIDEPPTRGQFDRQIPIHIRKDYDGALHCNGNGTCYNFDPDDAMCPSWKATRERRHSPKGRASLMREWLRQLAEQGVDPTSTKPANLLRRAVNSLNKQGDFSSEVMEAMNGCLACKSCAGQCPVKVDIPDLRSKFMSLYYGRYLRPAKDYLVASLEATLPAMAKMPKLYNAAISNPLARNIMQRLNLIESPLLTGVNLQATLLQRGFAMADGQPHANAVIIVQDAFTSYFETQLVLDVFELLKKLGFTPLLAPFKPNGKPLHVHGFLDRFKQAATDNSTMLQKLAQNGVPLVGIDPSMTLAYRSEYAKTLANPPKVALLQEWLAEQFAKQAPALKLKTSAFTLIPHCSEKTNIASAFSDWDKVFTALGVTLTTRAAGCCGMAGTFGHEADHRAQSKQIYAQSWAKIVAEQGENLLATGYSCRCQVKLIDKTTLRHPVQALLACF